MSFVQILYLPAPSLILQQTELNVYQQLEGGSATAFLFHLNESFV